MTPLLESFALWLADYYLLSGVLLVLALAALPILRQPAQRLAITKSSLVALLLLAALCAAPGWSVVHLLTIQQPRPSWPPVMAHQPDTTATTGPRTAEPINTDAFAPAHPAPLPSADSTPPWTASLAQVSWTAVGLLVYALGAGTILGWLCLGALAARRLVRSAQPAPAELIALMAEMAANNHRRAALLVSKEIGVAVALGLWRPVILLPHAWIKKLPLPFREGPGEGSSRDQLRPILAHECAHLRNHDLHWLAVSRGLLILLWAQPLYWLLRRRMRLDQEALADAAAAELTSRQTYAEQLVAWARDLSARPTVRLSAAVGLWEGPSQLRQRVALLVDEHFTVLRECSRNWRWASLAACMILAMGLSLVTFQPAQSELREKRSEQAIVPPNDTTVADESTRVAIDDRFILCRVTTDLQRSLLGDVASPELDASLCVFVNFAAFTDDEIAARSPQFVSLSDQLTQLAKVDNRSVFFHVPVASFGDSPFQDIQKRAESLAKLCEELGRRAGYKRARWSTIFYGEDFDWTAFIEKADSAAQLADSNAEASIGDDRVRVFPVRTFLSRLLVKADCVVNIIPVVRQKEGTRFPEDFIAAMKQFVPPLEYAQKKSMLIRVRFAESAKEGLDTWVSDRSAMQAVATQLGFENCNLQQTLSAEPEDTPTKNTTDGEAANQPVDIPIIVAKHVMLHDGKIVEWADVEKMVAALPNPKFARPGFYFTHGALPEREEEIRAKIWDLRSSTVSFVLPRFKLFATNSFRGMVATRRRNDDGTSI